jgi:hypothetical protein
MQGIFLSSILKKRYNLYEYKTFRLKTIGKWNPSQIPFDLKLLLAIWTFRKNAFDKMGNFANFLLTNRHFTNETIRKFPFDK